jgi:RimJ/RimL family protein N-acetyltransferase
MSLPDVIRVTNVYESSGVLLSRITDSQLEPHLPLDSEAIRYLPTGAGATAPSIRHDMADGDDLWGIHPIEGDTIHTLIGVVGSRDRGEHAKYLSTVLFKPELTAGRGYGTAAKLGLMAIGYEHGVERHVACIAESNVASHKSAAKVGFIPLPGQSREVPTGPDSKDTMWIDWLAFNPSINPNSLRRNLRRGVRMGQRVYNNTRGRYTIDPS